MEQRDYVRRLLAAYRATPGTCGAVRRADRALAAQLHQRGVPLEAVENAFVLAAARRLIRPAGAAPLGAIRSLAYFSPVIEKYCNCKSARNIFSTCATNSNVPLRRGSFSLSRNEISVRTARLGRGGNRPASQHRHHGHACGVDDDVGPQSQSCSRCGSLQSNATRSHLASSEASGPPG